MADKQTERLDTEISSYYANRSELGKRRPVNTGGVVEPPQSFHTTSEPRVKPQLGEHKVLGENPVIKSK